MRLTLPIFSLALSLLAAVSCTGSHGAESVAPSPQSGSLQLPAPAMLDELAAASRERSALAAGDYELLINPPLLSSGDDNVVWDSGNLMLQPDAANRSCWAILGLSGLPPDGSTVPELVSCQATAGGLWLGLPDYSSGRWQWIFNATAGWNRAASQAQLSPAGNTYVAVLRHGGSVISLSSLKLRLSGPLFDGAAPALSVTGPVETGGLLIAGYPLTFDFSATSLGEGEFVSAELMPDADEPPISIADLGQSIQFNYEDGGTKTATLRVTTEEQGYFQTASYEQELELLTPNREVLVLYNSNIPESQELAGYYVSPLSGRNIDPRYVLGLSWQDSAGFSPVISRADYAADIREPLKAFLALDENSQLLENVKYLLLMKGLPHQISGPGEFSVSAQLASVDSELCCLFSDTDNLDGSGSGYPLNGFLINDPRGLTFEPQARSFYLAGDQDFQRGAFDVCFDPSWNQGGSGDEVVYPLDFLVGRLDAYTYAEAQALVDRSLAAASPKSGWVVFDSSSGTYGQDSDTMVDPVWPWTDDVDAQSGEELLTLAGLNVFADVTTERIISTSVLLPPSLQSDGVIGYAGWGVNHNGGSWPNGNQYILLDLGWNYLPGACFMSYESFNATAFSEPINRRGQGQICDFLRMGGSCAIGNVWEPFTIGVGDERWVFDRYINHGDRWIEAAYKGLRLISWMEVVVGDPLCKLPE